MELMAGVLYWWHPVVPWARRQIREAEEEACDAWVVWALPAAPYATAMLATVDFLCGERARLVPMTMGIGIVPLLKKRLTKIMEGKTPRFLSFSGRVTIVMRAALLLPVGLVEVGARATGENT